MDRSIIREIKTSLRLSMNGVTSSLMRERGVDYKLNFGVDIPRLRRMAQKYIPGKTLAEALWKEETRELKILATLLYPCEEFTSFEEWMSAITNVELAEQASVNLFSYATGAEETAFEWILQDDLYKRLCGFSVLTRLMMQGKQFSMEKRQAFLAASAEAFYEENLSLKNAVLNALYRFSGQGEAEREMIRNAFSEKRELLDLLSI